MTKGHSTSRSLSALLAEGYPVIIDGALATYLETLGADISGALWSADILAKSPDLIIKTHLDYFKAGAQIAITASYQASIPGLIKHLNIPSSEAAALVKKSVDLAKEARDQFISAQPLEKQEESKRRLLIAGSVGPYGAFLADGSEYRGDYAVGKEEMKDFHRGRIDALVRAGVDVLALETIPQLEEAQALLELLQQEFPEVEAWMSFTLRDKSHLSDGTKLADIVPLLESSGQIVAFGFNCIPDELTLPTLQEMGPLPKKSVIVYPNSGEVWNAEKRDWEGQRVEVEELASRVKAWWDAGARLIGGCCRTGPMDIRVIEGALKSCRSSGKTEA